MKPNKKNIYQYIVISLGLGLSAVGVFLSFLVLPHSLKASDRLKEKAVPSHSISPVTTDRDNDGFPDSVEIIEETDRNNLRRWMVTIAESQFYAIHNQWPESRRDCTGLIVFSLKEALKKHDTAWLKGFKYLTDPAIPDVKSYQYPDIPIIGTHLFRSQPGTFTPEDMANGIFQPMASARLLMECNCTYLGKELDETIYPGDLLFFSYPVDERAVYHTMMLVKNIQSIPNDSEDDSGLTDTNERVEGIVVYHTGPDGKFTGEVRKTRISALNNHPNDVWHVKTNNPHFLGFYRLKILDYRLY